jgi:cytochrome P450
MSLTQHMPVTGVVGIAILALLIYHGVIAPRLRLPKGVKPLPGPTGLPLLGILPWLPKHHSWFQFEAWAKKYGRIYQINMAGAPHVVICSERHANALCRTRGSLYSDRPQFPMVAQLLSRFLRPVFLPYTGRGGEAWRAFRAFAHSVAMPAAAANYAPMQREEAVRMARDLVKQPEEYQTWLVRYSASVATRLAYGTTLYTGKEETCVRIQQVNRHLERVGSPGAYLVDAFPILMWLPEWLAPFKREGNRLHKEEYGLFKELVDDVRRRVDEGDPSVEGCFTERWLQDREKYAPAMSDDHAYYVLGTIFEAASETTAGAMQSFFLAMILHPEVFRKLSAEVDEVVGDERLPTFDDMENLPYLRACVKETLRWKPVTAGGLPHQLTERDDFYEGYLIPKGSVIHNVQWAIHQDEELYPEPDKYLPERWLEPRWPTYKEPLTVYPNLTNYSSFGFGRRICPGHHIAERSLYIETALIAWVGTLEEKPGFKPSQWEYTTGFNTHPKYLHFNFTTRRGRGKLLEEQYAKIWGDKVSGQFGIDRQISGKSNIS